MSSEKKVILAMEIAECDFEFASSIDSATAMTNDELLLISESIRAVDDLKPSCDKLGYALKQPSPRKAQKNSFTHLCPKTITRIKLARVPYRSLDHLTTHIPVHAITLF